MSSALVPRFTEPLRKNDALFIYGALQPKPFVLAYEQKAIEVVHGPSCRVDREVNTAACANDAVPVVARRTGGGTVVLVPGVVVIVIVGNREDNDHALGYFNLIHDAMIQALAAVGISGIEKAGISDLAIFGKKILGSSLYLGTAPRCYYYQSSLLVSADIPLFAKYLHHPPREPGYRRERSHEEFCTTLRNEGFAVDCSGICTLLHAELTARLAARTSTGESS